MKNKTNLVYVFQMLFLTTITISSRLKVKTLSKALQSSQCAPLCLECDSQDASMCNLCKNGVFQYNSSCYSLCPVGTYPDQEWQTCRQCDTTCPICWGPESDMCGSAAGQKTIVVLLENEIKNYFSKRTLSESEILGWMRVLNVILKDQPNFTKTNIETLSASDVYSTKNIDIDLPVGAFSRNGGVFIPMPSYLNQNNELVHSHWIFVKGAWNGRVWNNEWAAYLPSYIKYHGERNKIYFENGGYWAYDNTKGWFWVKATTEMSEAGAMVSNDELIAELNTIKFDVLFHRFI